MPEERFTYSVKYPGVRAPGLTVGEFAVAFAVTDYTGTAEDRTAGLRGLAAEAMRLACRQLAARYPDLLLADVTIPRLELAIALQMPTWFQGSPPAGVAERVAGPLVQAVPGAAGAALAAASAAAVAELAPDLQLELRQVYEAAKAALAQGDVAAGARLYRAAEQRRTWHEAALHVAADLPAAAGAISAPSRGPEPGAAGA
ncbi:MAG: hypothetical protein JWN15_1950, partial [Firmicutes bacterium]|nr:hypothetical protein [Bacillota bacterium]